MFGTSPAEDEVDDVAVTLFEETKIGGLQGRRMHTITGCRCGAKMVKTFLCREHRYDHLEKVTKQARRFSEWRIRRYEGKICPICRYSTGVDYWSFAGRLGGDRHTLIAYWW